MKGRHKIVIQNNRVRFEIEVKRNITIIRGDSATGKTTLYEMVEQYDRLGLSSGINLSCDKTCTVVTSRNWQNELNNIKDSIIFFDEESLFIKTEEFAKAVKNSDNYYVLITRNDLPNLPYSVEEIYGIHNSGKYKDTKLIYNSFYHLYTINTYSEKVTPQTIITEDSNSGKDFFDQVAKDHNITCFSAHGKSNISNEVKKYKDGTVLVIGDGAAFGPEMNRLYLQMLKNTSIKTYLPESFEWLILKSGLIKNNELSMILQNPEKYIDSAEFFSWERYFTKKLQDSTNGTFLKYDKARLNNVYLHEHNKNEVLKVLEESNIGFG